MARQGNHLDCAEDEAGELPANARSKVPTWSDDFDSRAEERLGPTTTRNGR